ncbi:porphobilinogen synthase [Thermoproteota archaeon]
MSFPNIRMRRLRKTENIRNMMQEVRLSPNDLILPIFIQEGINESVPIPTMPDVNRVSVVKAVEDAKEAMSLKIPAVILFGIPSEKDQIGSSAYDKNGIIQKAVQKMKKELGESLTIITDTCLCEYTNHGHCGIMKDEQLLNDETLVLLGKIAVSQAESGVDIVAPSGMIDGQVKTIRNALDKEGYVDVKIMSYSAKFASAFYAPFREAVKSAPQFGDRKNYQMNYSNPDEAMREIDLDIKEGADIIMVKPALAYLDLIQKAKSLFNIPIAAYNVSGEYSLVKAGSERGWIDEKEIVLEIITAIKRAGTDIIITNHAKDLARWLKKQ